jgi:dTDP-4-dehydrorhamnose 3,5-epimerase
MTASDYNGKKDIMIFNSTPISGAYLVDIEEHKDDRGFFGRAFCANEFRDRGIPFRVAQANVALSKKKGTLRGLHYQVAPHEEAKLVRCVRGAVFDVIVDLRKDSESYGRWFGTQLSAAAYRLFHLPAGTAHGYLALEDNSEIIYLVSQFYAPGAEHGIRWDDPAFNIQWPLTDDLIISEKDRSWADFSLD